MDVESIFGDEEVWSRQARVTVRTGDNFWSERWTAIKILQEFPDALFLVVDVESIIGDEEVWSRQARVTVRTGDNFWSDR
jgi:nucleoside phosphorylase